MKKNWEVVKLSRKNVVQMIVSILVILFLLWFFTGGLVTSAAKKDIFSTEPHQIIAESENWALSVPKGEGKASYLIYKGADTPGEVITVSGLYSHHTETAAGKKAVPENNQVEEVAVLDRHFLAGEKRWFLSADFAAADLNNISITITWKSGTETHSEQIG